MEYNITNSGHDADIYIEAIQLLVRNLPQEDMRATARMLKLNPDTPKRTWACLANDRVVGALVGDRIRDDVSYLEFAWILPEFRQIGLGKKILEKFELSQRLHGTRYIEAETYEPMVAKWMERMGYKITQRKGKMLYHRKEL